MAFWFPFKCYISFQHSSNYEEKIVSLFSGDPFGDFGEQSKGSGLGRALREAEHAAAIQNVYSGIARLQEGLVS